MRKIINKRWALFISGEQGAHQALVLSSGLIIIIYILTLFFKIYYYRQFNAIKLKLKLKRWGFFFLIWRTGRPPDAGSLTLSQLIIIKIFTRFFFGFFVDNLMRKIINKRWASFICEEQGAHQALVLSSGLIIII